MFLFAVPWGLIFVVGAVGLILSGQREQVVSGLLFYLTLIFQFGLLAWKIKLLKGYATYIHGEFNRKISDRLWIATALYSAIFFFPSLYFQMQCMIGQQCYTECRPYGDCNWFLKGMSENSTLFITLTVWWGIGTFLPLITLLLTEDDSTKEVTFPKDGLQRERKTQI